MNLLKIITCGSVDDGKSTLIGRLLLDLKAIPDDQLPSNSKNLRPEYLLASITDGLKEEREKGITIDVAYRYFSSESIRFVLADCPGHFEFTKNMITGASHVECAIMLVDAKRGIQPQTLRHAAIVSIMNMSEVIVCINKMDTVNYSEEEFKSISAELKQIFLKLGGPKPKIVPVNALEGENIVNFSPKMPWYRGDTLMRYLEKAAETSKKKQAPSRTLIHFPLKNNSPFLTNIFAATQISGQISKGEKLYSRRLKECFEVKNIFLGEKQLDFVEPGMAISLQLVETPATARLMPREVLEVENAPSPSTKIEGAFHAKIIWMSNSKVELGRSLILRHISGEYDVCIQSLDKILDWKSLEFTKKIELNNVFENEIFKATLLLESGDLFADDFKTIPKCGSFSLLEKTTSTVLAAGLLETLEKK